MRLKNLLTAGVALGALTAATNLHADTYVSIFGGIAKVVPDGIHISSALATTYDYSYRLFTNGPGYYSYSNPPNTYFFAAYDLRVFFSNMLRASQFNAYSFEENTTDTGFVVGTALGYSIGQGFRSELEMAFRAAEISDRNSVSGIARKRDSGKRVISAIVGTIHFFSTANAATPSDTTTFFHSRSIVPEPISTTRATNFPFKSDGDIESFSVMANLWYDYDMGSDLPVTPFIGAGNGVANLDIDYSGAITLPGTTASFDTDADDWVFAWQLGAGLGYEFDGGMMLSAQYRYFSTGDLDLMGQDVSIQSHEGLIALNIPFGN